MKNFSLFILLLVGVASSATYYQGNDSKPYLVKRPTAWMFDVQLGASESAYSQPLDLTALSLPLNSTGDTLRLVAAGNYIGFCYDVNDSTGVADSALVSFLPQFSNFASDNANPNALRSDTWTTSADSVQLAARSDSIYVAQTAVKNISLPSANSHWLRFKATNRAGAGKNAGQRCKVAVQFKDILR